MQSEWGVPREDSRSIKDLKQTKSAPVTGSIAGLIMKLRTNHLFAKE